nr:single-stranded-DNA-specific exonuclease RecJ [Deltaproteobacteria bacterium]
MSSFILEKPWDFASLNTLVIEELAKKSGIPDIIAKFLYQRGINTPEAVSQHLSPTLKSLSDPWKMKDMDKAVDRLVEAVARKEQVAVFGDYDVDGITSSALIFEFLEDLGLKATVYIPHREKEGYGLNGEALRNLASRGYRLLITVDCGISDNEAVALAGELGMDVIITDHHEPPDSLPIASAVLNPKRPDCAFAFKELAGVGVAFNLVRALRHRLYELGHWNGTQIPNLKKYLDFVALGTVADVVPLLGDNRILVRAGLEILAGCDRPGIKALKALCSLDSGVTSKDIAFRIAPRINAAGRMAHADKAFKLLVTKDGSKAKQLAAELHLLNQKRQTEENKILNQALGKIRLLEKQTAYVLSSPEWKKGVIGIVASRLVEQLHRPVILLSMDGDEAHGSGRSPEGINLYESLCACSGHLSSFGGHMAAAGISLPSDSIEVFCKAFQKVVASILEQTDVCPRLMVDCTACIEELIDPGFPRFYEYLEPFGAGYPPPVFAVRNFSVMRSTVVGNGHLKLSLTPRSGIKNTFNRGSVDLVGWGHGDKIDLPWDELELACRPCINVWQGRKQLELRLKDIRYR